MARWSESIKDKKEKIVAKLASQGVMRGLAIVAIVVSVLTSSVYTLLFARFLFGPGSGEEIGKYIILGATTAILMILVISIQIYIRKRVQKKLVESVDTYENKDPLTGLANKKSMKEICEKRQKEGGKGTFATLNVSSLEEVNDIFGYVAGSRLLDDVARELEEFVKEGESLARWKGGYFLLLMVPMGREDAIRRMTKLLEHLEEITVRTEPRSCAFQCSYSCGLTELSQNKSFDELCMEVSLVRKYAQSVGRKAYCGYFEDEMVDELRECEDLERDLEKALRGGEFHTWMIPQYNLNTGEIFGAEAQVRWKHPERGWIEQEQMENVLKGASCSGGITLIALKEICSSLKRWLDSGWMPVPIFLNVAIEDLYWKEFMDQAKKIVLNYDIPPALLYLDVSGKNLSKDLAQAEACALGLVEEGIKLSIDEWESYGSFINILWNVPASAVKINMRKLAEKQAVQSQSWNDRKKAIFTEVLKLSNVLNLRVICTMVEERSQIELLKNTHCYAASGPALSEPLDLVEFEERISPDYAKQEEEKDENIKEDKKFHLEI